jgi:hypothetical protein
MEIYKEIQGFKRIYTISNKGNVKNIKTGKILKPGKHTQGYMQIGLSINNKSKTFKIHRLIAFYFIPNPYNLPSINHIDGDKTNNNIKNLEWCTTSQNNQHAYNLGLRFMTKKNLEIISKKVIDITSNKVYSSVKEVAKIHNLVYGSLVNKLNGKRTNNTNFKYLNNE